MRISSRSASSGPMPSVASSVPPRLRKELLRGRPRGSGTADILSTPGALGAEHPFPAGRGKYCWGVWGRWEREEGYPRELRGWGWGRESCMGWREGGEGMESDGEMERERERSA